MPRPKTRTYFTNYFSIIFTSYIWSWFYIRQYMNSLWSYTRNPTKYEGRVDWWLTTGKPYQNSSPDLNLTPLAAFLRFLPSAARVRSDLSQFSWGRSKPKVVRWQIKDQSCFSYPEMMFQINLCYFLCWLVSLLLSWVQWNYSIGGKYCTNVRLLQNTFTLSPMMHLSSQW